MKLGNIQINMFNNECIELMQSQTFLDLTKNKKVCIVTDPPFNVGYHYNKYKDNLDEDEYYSFLDDVFSMYNFPFVVIHYPEQLYKISFQTGVFPNKVVSWVYNSNNSKQHRDIAFFKITPNFELVRQPYKNPNDKRIKERIAKGSRGGRLYDWWNINQVKNVSKDKTEHPCQMPLEVMKNIIGILPSDYLIFDPFMGSGTTALACKELKRDFIGCEIDEAYYKIAVDRLNGLSQKDVKRKDMGILDMFDFGVEDID